MLDNVHIFFNTSVVFINVREKVFNAKSSAPPPFFENVNMVRWT